MNFSFNAALARLGVDAAFTIMNAARPASDFLFATLLPEMPSYDYTIRSGTMTVKTTMAGLAATDSPYPPGGFVQMSKFLEESAKIANQVTLSEMSLRELQAMLRQLQINRQPVLPALATEALNFLEKVIIQAHLDTMEWLRGQALVGGQINWTFNGMNLLIDYGINASHILTHRTGNDAYGGSASKFWADVRAARRLLSYNVRTFIAHPTTIDEIVFNDANVLEVTSQSGLTTTVQRLIGANDRPSRDARDQVTLVGYDREGEVLDPADPDTTQTIPFMPVGKILAIGNNTRSGYRVGQGSTDDPVADLALGYTHLAPTVEAGGRPGRWADLYTPERAPMHLVGRGVTNGLPVLENPEKIVILSTAIA